MTNWGKFESIDAKELNKEVAELKESNGDYPEIPHGTYEVKIAKMELRPTKKTGAPMLSVQFKILEGEFKNMNLWMNQVIVMGDHNDKFRLHNANEFLRSLDTGIDIVFEGVRAYENLVAEVFEAVKDQGLEYAIEYGQNKNGYDIYRVKEVFAD